MSIVQLRGSYPTAPPELQEEVELYAREVGRTAKLHFVPILGWFVEFSLRANDPMLRSWQEGRASEPPKERSYFHVPYEAYDPARHIAISLWRPVPGQEYAHPFVPLDILQMGRSGVRQWLDERNTWSGRGVVDSHEEATQLAREHNEKRAEKIKDNARDKALSKAKDTRRSRLKIPFWRVGKDIGSKEKSL